jgi:hypothetical protein
MKLTDNQRLLISDLMLKNMEFSMETDAVKKLQLSIELRKMKTRLKRSMGAEAYAKFITQGKQAYGIPAKD